MSRRSLRIHAPGPYAEKSAPDYGSASFSLGVPSRREVNVLKSSGQHSQSYSQSLMQTPQKRPGHSPHHQHNSSLHSVGTDASLLSSMLDESSIRERTLIENFWGLDHDADPHESTVISDHGAILANSTLIADGEGRCHGHSHPAQTQTSMVNGYACKDCSLHSDRKEAPAAHGPFRYPPPPRAGGPSCPRARDAGHASPPSTIYGREKGRKGRTGLFVSVWDSVEGVRRRGAAFPALLLALLYKHVLLRKPQDNNAGVSHPPLVSRRRATAVTLFILRLASLLSQRIASQVTRAALHSWNGWRNIPAISRIGMLFNGALSRSSRNMDSGTNKRLDLSVSLCSYVSKLAQKAGSAGWAVTRKLLSHLWSTGLSTGQACFRWLQRGCHHAGSLMSVLGNFFLNRCLRHLSRLLLVLLMLFVLFILLGWLRPSDLTSRLPAIDVTDWQKALPLANIPGLSSILNLLSTWGQPAHDPPEATGDVQASPATPSVPPPPPPPPQEAQEEGVPPVDATRLLRLEQSLSLLWERVEGGGRRAEQMHGEVLGIHQALQQQQQQLQSEPHRMNHLLEDKLAEMRAQLEEDRLHREQTRKHHLAQQQSQASHLAEMELLLHALAAKTEQVQQRQEAVTTLPYPTSLPVSVSVASESHDALVSEVSQLEAALASLRQDLEGLRGCQHQCERLDTVQATISSEVRARVREDLRALFYGNQLVPVSEASGDPEALPESLLQWLAERYVSGADLRASLASLELGVLRNISLQLEQLKRQWGAELPSASARRTVEHAMGAAGAPVTEEQVQLMVKNALRLYSQDQTGQADYALESGGGSILSTRCSETYETRTALLSLFGLPLWYFSQSPRVVIQPDVQPGNCWAFKGSTGYLVIRLSLKIVPTAFSLEHIPKVLAPSGALRSAPRDFVVYGLDNENQEMGKLVGSYTYDEDGDALQTYAVSEENDQAYQIIEVRILSNWGNQAYTCIYRFRVHGKPSRN